jgi:hypothetical protein
LVAAWNILGITDFVVAIIAGFATGPSPLQLAAFDNQPLIASSRWCDPTFLVPLWTVLHIAPDQLRRAGPPPSRHRHDADASTARGDCTMTATTAPAPRSEFGLCVAAAVFLTRRGPRPSGR